MKRIMLMVTSIVLVLVAADSESSCETGFYAHGGVAFPSNPDRFSDYWRPGLTLGAGLGFELSKSALLVTLIDYGRFSIDEERFFKGIQLPASGNSISGAATSVVSGSLLLRYFPSGPRRIIPAFFDAGLSFTVSSIDDAEATYSGYPVSQGSETHLGVSLALGGGLSFPLSENIDLVIQGRYPIALTTNERANSHFSPITIGIRGAL